MNPILQVFNLPHTLDPILENLQTSKDLFNCSLVNRQFARCTRPLLEHPALRMSSSPWLRRLADVVPVEKLASIRHQTFIFERLLEGFTQEKASSYEETRQSLKSLLAPLTSKYFLCLLSEQEIESIANKVLCNTSDAPLINEMCSELKQAGFTSAIEQLECAGALTLTKVKHLYSKGGILALLHGLSSEALQAFAQISDEDISAGIAVLMERQHTMSGVSSYAAEAKCAADVVAKMVKSDRLFVNYPHATSGQVPLHYASDSRSEPVVRDLIKYGADVNWTSDSGQTAAHFAAARARVEVLQVLVDSGRLDSINCQDKSGNTPLHFAGMHSDTVNFLLKNGATRLDQLNVTAIA